MPCQAPKPWSDPIRQGPPKSVTPNSRIPVIADAPHRQLAARLPWHGSCWKIWYTQSHPLKRRGP